jgi:selenide,water dikinase
MMATLNAAGAQAMRAVGVSAATDITGFGLMGHGTELAEASGVTLRIDAHRLPFAPGARRLAERGIVSGGANRNRGFLGEKIAVEADVPADIAALAFDSETSGGLLIAVSTEKTDALVAACRERGTPCAAIIGEVLPREPGTTIRLASGKR